MQKPTNVQTSTNVQSFTHKCANISPTNVQICKTSSTTNVQTSYLQMCKRSVLTGNVQKTFHKCANHCLHQESVYFNQIEYRQFCLRQYNTLKCIILKIVKNYFFSVISWSILILFVLSDRAGGGFKTSTLNCEIH